VLKRRNRYQYAYGSNKLSCEEALQQVMVVKRGGDGDHSEVKTKPPFFWYPGETNACPMWLVFEKGSLFS
jgi:hypothetical protein